MVNLIKPYNDDPFVGHLSTPVTASTATISILGNLPAYRKGLTPYVRGLEVGLAHGYFIFGPFAKLGPLRNSDIGLLAGFLSATGLLIILAIALLIYGLATFQKADSGEGLETKKGWRKFTSGFFVGGLGGAAFALFVCTFWSL
jgi:photosystem I subunit 11|tara:strand:+ start:2911 stop:3342 length:432 start_codon:yes stop_codon:yes gene_type:complete